MKQKIYQVDAFCSESFKGNPAAVCVMDQWLPDELMQSIAAENNLSETAFVVPIGEEYQIRWFTPAVEVALCGHATLASAFVLFTYYKHKGKEIVFQTREKGSLKVKKHKKWGYELDFPVQMLVPIQNHDEISKAVGGNPIKTIKGETDFMLVYESEEEIAKLTPNFSALAKTKARGIIATARGKEVDFVSRFFAPGSGIDEDPVTGSAHTILTPYWSKELGKLSLSAKQISKREGALQCELKGERVLIAGNAVAYLEGEIIINPQALNDVPIKQK